MMADAPDRDALIALLDFHVAAGVDLALDETPHDRFAEAVHAEARREGAFEPTSPPGESRGPDQAVPDAGLSRQERIERPPERDFTRTPSLSPRLPAAATAPPDEIAGDARQLARTARDLAELEAIVAAFDRCTLKSSAKQLVFADGTAGSAVMFVGEAPGAEEDRTGKPFVGRAGQLLDRMLAAIGLDRGQVYIANVVPWRPPGNRTPTPQETAICLPFIERQIELAAPRILVTLGASATQTLAGTKEGIRRSRGRWLTYERDAFRVPVLPMLHPAYLLRQPIEKRLAWRDLRLLRKTLDEAARPEQKSGPPN